MALAYTTINTARAIRVRVSWGLGGKPLQVRHLEQAVDLRAEPEM